MRWFKHDCDSHQNPDIQLLKSDWGWDWVGRWWTIVEMVGSRVAENRLTFSLQMNNGDPFPVKLLARELGTTVERLTSFCSFLADNLLIDKESWYDKNLLCIPNLRKRSDEYTNKLLTKSRRSADQDKDEEIDTDKKSPTVDETSFEYQCARAFFDAVKKKYPTLVIYTFSEVAPQWIGALQKLQRIDGHTQEEIRTVVDFVRNRDEFWGEQIRAIPKLRQEDKQGTPYFNLMLRKAADRQNHGKTGQIAMVDTVEEDPHYKKFIGAQAP